ncbi:hypothetical protein [Streptomyces stelliscabiei]|uniref:hypothetical protein n=1 Tax=Streptomyces stelliscabiei TaxID=146820 RepID=UPI0029AA3CD4|nr:hypothetical protein [Streptomyces stelliscabiei]MDX2553887.1 hypothetical protein [Streptomyces stelliscabiei]MDX2612630.1 hypothetical protein [Streptomyces stelliscabiei]MDX2638326.1 hypothetical protein [Streptomyces stelliscabiei]MDX2663797.1 hypothetical protein [Streptomyces stelliscabiei]MDX2715416.1 hypothetical protein [Streptomyces stelliscabiei]
MAAALGASLAALALLLLGAPPSAAGGPTSVLLVSPTSHRTASLYGSGKQYDLLVRLLVPAGSALDGSREKAPDWGPEGTWGGQVGDMVTVTWMSHEVTAWRVDRLYMSAPDTKDVWIYTGLETAEDAATAGEGVWHKAKQSEELRALLRGLGVLGEPSDGAVQGTSSDDALTGSGTETGGTVTGTRAAADASGPAGHARWAIPALALGLLLGSGGATLLLRRAAARHESGPPREPRQELLDA